MNVKNNSNTDPTNVKNNSNVDPTNVKNNSNVDPTNANNNPVGINSEQNNLKDYEQTPEDNRFTDAISSFKGAQATSKEMEMAAKMVKFFENNPI
jgi:hypothetical protein